MVEGLTNKDRGKQQTLPSNSHRLECDVVECDVEVMSAALSRS